MFRIRAYYIARSFLASPRLHQFKEGFSIKGVVKGGQVLNPKMDHFLDTFLDPKMDTFSTYGLGHFTLHFYTTLNLVTFHPLSDSCHFFNVLKKRIYFLY